MDKIYHFFISLLLTYFVFFLLFPPKAITPIPPFDENPKNPSVRRKMILGISIGLCVVFVIGIWKEWFDQWGFGNVEVGDVAADILGIAAGYGLSRLKSQSRNTTVHIDVHLNSTATKKPSEEILPDNHQPVRFQSTVHKKRNTP